MFTVGSPGGTTIITTVAEMIINLVDFDMDLAEAVAEPRLYANSEPAIYPEASVPGDVQQGLRGLGYELAPFTRLGNVMTIRRDPETGEYTGAADFRNGGATRGV